MITFKKGESYDTTCRAPFPLTVITRAWPPTRLTKETFTLLLQCFYDLGQCKRPFISAHARMISPTSTNSHVRSATYATKSDYII